MQLRIFHDNLYIEETFEQIMELPITFANNICDMATFLTCKKRSTIQIVALLDHFKTGGFFWAPSGRLWEAPGLRWAEFLCKNFEFWGEI